MKPTNDRPVNVRRRRQMVTSLSVLLVLLALSVPAALSLLARDSSANFAASENVGVNRLGAATLDIEVGSASTEFEATNMAPGDIAIGALVLANAGSLPLSYAITATNTGGVLAEWLLFDVWIADDCEEQTTGERLVEGLRLNASGVSSIVGDPATGTQPGDRQLAPLESETVCVAARLPLAAPNEIQGTTVSIGLVIDAEHDVTGS